MSDFDLLVRGREQDIGISDGKIVALSENLPGSAASELDARDLTIFPGVIDAHVHFNEPGRSDWEGFSTGSRAAAAGGTTTVFEMPLNAHPPTTNRESFELKRVAAEASSLVDFGLWGGLVPGNLSDLEALRDCGVVGLKAFMCTSGIDDFPSVDTTTLHAGMDRAGELGLLVAVHAESRASGVDVTCETCPHYLVLTEHDMEHLGAVAKCAPPLRAAEEQPGLRDRLSDVTTIGSDHSPAPPEMKQRDNFFDVWGGIS